MSDEYKILSKINYPSDIRNLDKSLLPLLCDEIRNYILKVISCTAGHLGSSLGVVELAVAIHYVFETPDDNLVWDVGHQCYPHKIITGRKHNFETIRTQGGISGFPKIAESKYDSFGTGHASTSISATLGMAIADIQQGQTEKHSIAVIGDGSIAGGMAFEALNNTGASNANILIVLNDNRISIDKSVGAFKEYLLHISMSKSYNKFRNKLWQLLSGNERKQRQRRFLRQVKRNIKSSIFEQGNMFESLGIRYFGPTDGHDVLELVDILSRLKSIKGPKLLHCITLKGKGYSEAEKDQVRFHAPGIFNIETGCPTKSSEPLPPKYQDVFGYTITKLAENNEKIVGITAAMATGCSLNMMMEKFPDRTFDVGICEEHAVTFAAGMAIKGLLPYVAIYSSFLQRAYDQIIHDVALQQLPVIFCIDRAGLVGEDGPTHHGAFDLAYLRNIPNMIISAPLDEKELQDLLYTAQFTEKPFAIRYPRSRGVHIDWKKNSYNKIPIGSGRILHKGNKIAVISIGDIGNEFVKVLHKLEKEAPTINPTWVDMRFLKPLDKDLLHKILNEHETIITIEDGTIVGGFGSAVSEFASDNNYNCRIIRLGIPDNFIEQGTISQLKKLCGIDTDSIINILKAQK